MSRFFDIPPKSKRRSPIRSGPRGSKFEPRQGELANEHHSSFFSSSKIGARWCCRAGAAAESFGVGCGSPAIHVLAQTNTVLALLELTESGIALPRTSTPRQKLLEVRIFSVKHDPRAYRSDDSSLSYAVSSLDCASIVILDTRHNFFFRKLTCKWLAKHPVGLGLAACQVWPRVQTTASQTICVEQRTQGASMSHVGVDVL